MELTSLQENIKIHLYVEQFLNLAEGLLYSEDCKKDTEVLVRK